MQIILFGATGRVGKEFMRLALDAGHKVTAVVRDVGKVAPAQGLRVLRGDAAEPKSLESAFGDGSCDAIVNVIGGDPLKASTVVTDAARAIVPLAEKQETRRYLGITGTAEMPKTLGGKISIFVLRRTPVGHGALDHDGAIEIIKASKLDWFLVGCPWIKDGPTRGAFKTSPIFPGGMRIIHPGDVALALFRELEAGKQHRKIQGIWY